MRTIQELLDDGKNAWTGPERHTLYYSTQSASFDAPSAILPGPVQVALRSVAK